MRVAARCQGEKRPSGALRGDFGVREGRQSQGGRSGRHAGVRQGGGAVQKTLPLNLNQAPEGVDRAC